VTIREFSSSRPAEAASRSTWASAIDEMSGIQKWLGRDEPQRTIA